MTAYLINENIRRLLILERAPDSKDALRICCGEHIEVVKWRLNRENELMRRSAKEKRCETLHIG
jgi:hypothetical protein